MSSFYSTASRCDAEYVLAALVNSHLITINRPILSSSTLNLYSHTGSLRIFKTNHIIIFLDYKITFQIPSHMLYSSLCSKNKLGYICITHHYIYIYVIPVYIAVGLPSTIKLYRIIFLIYIYVQY